MLTTNKLSKAYRYDNHAVQSGATHFILHVESNAAHSTSHAFRGRTRAKRNHERKKNVERRMFITNLHHNIIGFLCIPYTQGPTMGKMAHTHKPEIQA